MSPDNPKALFRKALAHEAQGDTNEAIALLEVAILQVPNDKAIRKKVQELNQVTTRYYCRQGTVCFLLTYEWFRQRQS